MTNDIVAHDIEIDPEDRCPNGGGHEWQEWSEYELGPKHYQDLRCQKCGKHSLGWMWKEESK